MRKFASLLLAAALVVYAQPARATGFLAVCEELFMTHSTDPWLERVCS